MGFTWSDAGAFAGGIVGGAVAGPPGAMLGAAAASFVGGTVGDGNGTGKALEEAAVAGIGSAGGAWAADLAGKFVRDGIVHVASKALSTSAVRQVDQVASKVLLPWNKYDASPIAALGAGLAGYEASPQSRSSSGSGSPGTAEVTDIGNGGCPVQLANIVMPEKLSAPIEKVYRELPGYLCGVWRDFGREATTRPQSAEPPGPVTGSETGGIDTYARKAAQLNAAMADFVALERELAPLALRSAAVSERGRDAVTALVTTVDRGAVSAPAPGPTADEYALEQLDWAFRTGRTILATASADTTRVADDIDALTRSVRSLGEKLDDLGERVAENGRRPIVVPAPRVTIDISNDAPRPARLPEPDHPVALPPVSFPAPKPGPPAASVHSAAPTPWARSSAEVTNPTPWTAEAEPVTPAPGADTGYAPRIPAGAAQPPLPSPSLAAATLAMTAAPAAQAPSAPPTGPVTSASPVDALRFL